MVGRTIGKYRVIEQIGRGGMGTVYKAIDETLDRRVAIKVLNADLIDQEAVERFRREAMTLAKLNHGRIGAIHELTRDEHDLLMVMEFLEGETFEKLIERGRLPIPRAVTLCAQVLDALQYAHAAGVIHRDLKPANVIVTPSGDIKVMDFGIARVQGSEHLTTNGFMVGTPAYMAPEQVRGEEVDPRMDLYAVAVVLYRMLTQRLPFTGDTAIAMIHSQLHNPPTPIQQFRTDLPEWLVKILDRGLAKAPGDRFQTAAEFRSALESGLTGKMQIPVLPADADETMRPTLTPPEMRIPATPSGVGPASGSPSSAALPSVAPSGVAPATPSSIAPVTPSAVAASAITSPPATGAMPPIPPAPPPARAEATVTLRAPHLATAGILLALLVVGVIILAVVALRRPTTTVVAPPDVSTPLETAPSDAQASTNDPSATATPAPGTTDPSAPATTPSTPTPAVASPTPPAGTTPSATSPVPPVAAVATTPTRSAAPAAGTTAASPAAGTTATGRAAGAGARGSTTPATGSTPATAAGPLTPTPTAPVAAPAPVAPAAANAPAENFGDIKALVVDGSRSREVDALLSLEPGNLVVRSRADGSVLRTLPYAGLSAATYARAKRPRGQTIPAVAVVPENLGGSGFLGGDRHWLTLQTPAEFLIIRLEDRNVTRVLSSIEARMGSKVLRTQGE